MKLADLFRPTDIAPSNLRQEIFALGDRYRGDALAGARRELDDPHLTAERRRLLRAVVAHLASGGTGGDGAVAARIHRPASLADAAYIGVIAAAAGWAVMVARSLLS